MESLTHDHGSASAKSSRRVKTGRRLTTAALTVSLLAGAAAISAPEASAAPRAQSTCHKQNFYNWIETNGARLRTGPSSSYKSRGLLYNGDRMKFSRSCGRWLYGKVLSSTTGLKGYGWVRDDMLYNHNG
ncbi:SH3 domain-containing protein [Streptomyces decoyicus]